jgi:hypothetical protein
MDEDAAVSRGADGVRFGFGDAAVEDIGGFCPQSRPVGLPINLVPTLCGLTAKRFHPLDVIATGVYQLEDERHPVLEFIGA